MFGTALGRSGRGCYEVGVSESERDPRLGEMSEVPRAPSPADDAMTRLWERADASHGHHVEAVAELRERKRREQDAPRRANDVRVNERVECERCKRTVEAAGSAWVAIPAPVAESVQHLLCSRCADEVRRGLLRLLAGQDPLPAQDHDEQGLPLPISARAGWFAFRMAAYALIALTVFALVTWLSVR